MSDAEKEEELSIDDEFRSLFQAAKEAEIDTKRAVMQGTDPAVGAAVQLVVGNVMPIIQDMIAATGQILAELADRVEALEEGVGGDDEVTVVALKPEEIKVLERNVEVLAEIAKSPMLTAEQKLAFESLVKLNQELVARYSHGAELDEDEDEDEDEDGESSDA